MYNTVIIGAGIAGMTASIYLKRANVPFLLIEKSAPGGQINRASNVENYPGFSSIDGPSLAMNIYNQIEKLGIDIRFGEVKKIEIENDQKKVYLDNEIIKCQNIIIATGRKSRELNLENEKGLIGHGVSYCALCDGIFYKDKDVAVVGGGNSAFEEAYYLSTICKKVFLIHRSNNFRASSNIQDKVKKKDNIVIKENLQIKTINEENTYLKSVILSNDEELKIDGLFIYIGSTPDTSFLNNLNIDNDNGYLIVDEDMQTSIKGIYACGDVIDKKVYQLSTAVGEATIAANSIIKNND